MFTSISFCVDKKTIHIYGREFTLGELSVQMLNIPCSDIDKMFCLLRQGKALTEQYEGSGDYTFWFQANDTYLKLETMLRKHPLFALLQNDSILWNTTVLEHRDWAIYRSFFEQFTGILRDLLQFYCVIRHFVANLVMSLPELNANSISDAMKLLTDHYYTIYFPDKKRCLFYPYHNNRPIKLGFKNQVSPSGEYQIVETYTTENLLMLLKIDFYKALEAGHMIRQCAYCGRFFLLTKRLHTKYCDNPAPNSPEYTCAQMGYRLTRRKEKPEDDPKSDALRRCLQRITKDCSRGIITEEEKALLKAKAEALYHEAKIHSGVTYDAFQKSLESQNLYPLCGVKRKSKPVGHPKREAVRS